MIMTYFMEFPKFYDIIMTYFMESPKFHDIIMTNFMEYGYNYGHLFLIMFNGDFFGGSVASSYRGFNKHDQCLLEQ